MASVHAPTADACAQTTLPDTRPLPGPSLPELPSATWYQTSRAVGSVRTMTPYSLP